MMTVYRSTCCAASASISIRFSGPSSGYVGPLICSVCRLMSASSTLAILIYPSLFLLLTTQPDLTVEIMDAAFLVSPGNHFLKVRYALAQRKYVIC